MSRLYGEQHRKLQDEFDSRRMADRIEAIAMKTEFGADERAFIESRDMFFLSTVDERGRPTVSYKGGMPGFVRVLDDKTLQLRLIEQGFQRYQNEYTREAVTTRMLGLYERLIKGFKNDDGM